MAERTSLTGVAVSDGYDQLLHVSNSDGLHATTLRQIYDGDGTASCLYLATEAAKFVIGTDAGDDFAVNDGTDNLIHCQGDLGSVTINLATSSGNDFAVNNGSNDLILIEADQGTVEFNADVEIVDGTNDLTVTSHDGTNGLILGATLVTATATELNAATDLSTRLIDGSGNLSITSASHNARILYNDADGATYTLPDATGSGMRFEVIIGTTVTSNSVIVQAPDADNTLHGTIQVSSDGSASEALAWSTADTAGADTVTLDGSTKGGVKGDYLCFTDIAADTWHVYGQITQTGTEATPFSAAVS